MLNDRKSHGLWEQSAPPPPPTMALAGDLAAEVVVIGSGFTGTSAALHLAERNIDVVVLEATAVGYGASGRNSGLVNAGMWVMPSALEKTLGAVHGQRLLTLLSDAPKLVFEIVEKHRIACELKRAGTIHCAVGESGLAQIRERARQWQALGAPVRVLDADETRAKTGTSAYPGGLLDLRAGTIQPLAYVRGLAGAAIGAGARIFTESLVDDIAREAGAWRVRTATGSVRANWVVLATDAYTRSIMSELLTEQITMPYFHIATAPLGDNVRRTILPEGQGAWDTRTVLSSFRMDDAGRLVMGSIGALQGTGAVIHRGWAMRHIRSLFPQLGDFALEHEWYGRIGMTDDHLPRLHMPAENIVAISGYNGRGIAPGTVFGRELARLIAGEVAIEEMPLPVTAPKDARFRRVMESFYNVGSQVAHLPPAR
jgi:glycine/D-amino acid oxidase-like deaminating enzyme